ncbi:MAG: hypothetical protein EKK57_04990 [Proteobacteria bacterium]|nr:MAG: hypothetical protein EKK57_04990 [Pseudomonadota bacterium]
MNTDINNTLIEMEKVLKRIKEEQNKEREEKLKLKTINESKINTVFPAGKYVITDPCYILDNNSEAHDDIWGDWLEKYDYFEYANYAEHEGIRFFAACTAYGDGCYPLYKNGVEIASLGVDAGLLSIIPFSLVEKLGSTELVIKRDKSKLLKIIDIDEEFTIQYSKGVFKFGNGQYCIDTLGTEGYEGEDEN